MSVTVQLHPFTPDDLPALVDYWNENFAGRRNFRSLRAQEFQQRVLDNRAFEADGLILAWLGAPHSAQGEIVGLVHAFRPNAAGPSGWAGAEPHHAIALLHVSEKMRRQGIGTRLLQAAERWLHYCPVYVGGLNQPCYGTLEQFAAPFFGSSERLGLSAWDAELIDFLGRRGYRAYDPGDVSMTLELRALLLSAPTAPPAMQEFGLHLVRGGTDLPFKGRSVGKPHWYEKGDGARGDAWHSLLVVESRKEEGGLLVGGLVWYETGPERCGLSNFWLVEGLRGRGVGAFLLDSALHAMKALPAPAGGYQQVELHTHLTRYPRALAMYQRRGFVIDALWVNLEKT